MNKMLSVWHNADDKPREGAMVAFVFNNDMYVGEVIHREDEEDTYFISYSGEAYYQSEITKWAYTEDILKATY